MPNNPYQYFMGPDPSSQSSGVSDTRAVGNHSRPTSALNFLSSSSSSMGGGSCLFTQRSIETDFDFGGGGSGGGGAAGSGISTTAGCWPLFPTSSHNLSSSMSLASAFTDPLLHSHQQHHSQRPHPEGSNLVLSAFMNAREDRSAQPIPPRFDSSAADVDLEAASSSLSPPEFLSKLRSQLAMAGAAGGLGSTQSVQSQATPTSVVTVTASMHTPISPISPSARDLTGGLSTEGGANRSSVSPKSSTDAVGAPGDSGSEVVGSGSGPGVGVVGDEIGTGTTGGG